jgi:hypothetical protein
MTYHQHTDQRFGTVTEMFTMTTDQHSGHVARWITTREKALRWFARTQAYGTLRLVNGSGLVIAEEVR